MHRMGTGERKRNIKEDGEEKECGNGSFPVRTEFGYM